jgi:2,4-dienoyl-CoA reductase-like NADH-dependent reductase (Old Yellow Enzyme family)
MAKPQMIFEPFRIKSMKLKNRIGLAPLLDMPGGRRGTHAVPRV